MRVGVEKEWQRGPAGPNAFGPLAFLHPKLRHLPSPSWLGDSRQGTPAETPQGADAEQGDRAFGPETAIGLAGLSTSGDPTTAASGIRESAVTGSARQDGCTRGQPVLLSPFFPFSTSKLLALKATVLLLLTLLIKARVQIAAGSALGIFLLLLQAVLFLAISGGVVLAAGGASVVATQQRRQVVA